MAFGQLPGAPWAAAKFAQDTPVFELGVGSAHQTRLASFWEAGLPRPRYGDAYMVIGARVALVGQHHQPGGGQFPHDASDPGRGQVVGGPGQRARDPQDLAVGGDDLEVHPMMAVLAGVERPAGSHPVDGD